jgi:isopentenyl-diphosphate delta-isomerase
VLLGTYNGNIYPDTSEVDDYCYLSSGRILEEMKKEPATFTTWFQVALPMVLQQMETRMNAAGV